LGTDLAKFLANIFDLARILLVGFVEALKE
jgi:hypothetical protein